MHTNKALVGLVLGMGLAIVVGLGVLVYGLVQKAADPSFRLFSFCGPGGDQGWRKGRAGLEHHCAVAAGNQRG